MIILVSLSLDSVGKDIMFLGCPIVWFVHPFVRPFDQILLPRYFINGLSNLNKTGREFSLEVTVGLSMW